MKNLIKIRKEKNYTQAELANFLKTTQSNYSKYERGETKPDPDTLLKLSEFFDVAVDYLLGNIDIPVSPVEYQLSMNIDKMSVEDVLAEYDFTNAGTELSKEQQRLILEQIIGASPDELDRMLKILKLMNDTK